MLCSFCWARLHSFLSKLSLLHGPWFSFSFPLVRRVLTGILAGMWYKSPSYQYQSQQGSSKWSMGVFHILQEVHFTCNCISFSSCHQLDFVQSALYLDQVWWVDYDVWSFCSLHNMWTVGCIKRPLCQLILFILNQSVPLAKIIMPTNFKFNRKSSSGSTRSSKFPHVVSIARHPKP